MCELMALTFARPAPAQPWLQKFAARGEENADGWGLACYPDCAALLIKEPLRWGASRLAHFLETYDELSSPIYLAHVRYKTRGDAPAYCDTHPFLRERHGREYVFAHNGTLEGNLLTRPLGHYRPLGVTDSEVAFGHLLGELDRRGGDLDHVEDWRWLHGFLSEINQLGKLNMLLSDGRRLFVYHDVNKWKGLHFRRLDRGFVVATCPLDEGSWTPLRTGELLVFQAGGACYSSHRDLASPEFG